MPSPDQGITSANAGLKSSLWVTYRLDGGRNAIVRFDAKGHSQKAIGGPGAVDVEPLYDGTAVVNGYRPADPFSVQIVTQEFRVKNELLNRNTDIGKFSGNILDPSNGDQWSVTGKGLLRIRASRVSVISKSKDVFLLTANYGRATFVDQKRILWVVSESGKTICRKLPTNVFFPTHLSVSRDGDVLIFQPRGASAPILFKFSSSDKSFTTVTSRMPPVDAIFVDNEIIIATTWGLNVVDANGRLLHSKSILNPQRLIPSANQAFFLISNNDTVASFIK